MQFPARPIAGAVVGVLAVASLGGASPGAAQAPSPGIERLVERVQERYRQAKDLRASFVQRRLNRFGGAIENHGRLYVRNPGRMRWEYEAPEQLVVIAGDERYLYLPDDNQVQVLVPDRSEDLQTPDIYLSGRGDLLRDFDISETSWGTPLAPGNVQVRLVPRRSASFAYLVMEVQPMSATIVRMVSIDSIDVPTDYQFRDVEFDVGLQDSLFDFEIPPGADVIYVGG